MRIFLVFIGLALFFAIPFILFGDHFDAWLEGEGALEWLRTFEAWAWAMAVALLVADLILPVPATAVMAGLGILYGPVVGGLIGAIGSVLSGVTAYAACRAMGRGAALALAGEKDLARAEGFFARSGGWAVVFSRWMPLMPEVIACMAGLARMPAGSFLAALCCGSPPMAFTFALIGHTGADNPLLALGASAIIPLLLWAVVRLRVRKK
ncbi:MAG: TVP38/TMEM64 family protein [Planctomycetota bacterium]|jgi:uncharacterized membrane protein YdjX (TVP38/TMEM64 family)